jgi:hypothetical protein
MRIIAFFTEAAPVEQILTHIGERRVRRRSRPPADRPPGTRHPSRCRTGTSSNSPSPTSRSISASPGSHRLSRRERCIPSRLPVSPCPEDAAAGPPERARLHRPDARQPRSWALTPHPTPASLLPRANLDAQGGLDFLSVPLSVIRSRRTPLAPRAAPASMHASPSRSPSTPTSPRRRWPPRSRRWSATCTAPRGSWGSSARRRFAIRSRSCAGGDWRLEHGHPRDA